jgi:hypothetical protein
MNGETRELALAIADEMLAVNVAMPQRRGGYVPTKAMGRSGSTAINRGP